MPKNILIFSDGTGQVGGLKPDQQLSNVYKIYRATRSGPDSEINPANQTAYYDAGLGAGETDGITFKRIRNVLSAGVGTGIDENVVDCYAEIVARYAPGDQVILIGFSRGAYTVRSVANVMNLCGVPTKMPDGSAVPRHGPKLRKIASDAVKFVYNHGAGKDRGAYEEEREAKATRFRNKYGSEGKGADGEDQGNVQPHFIGVFDTVAALQSRLVRNIVGVVAALLFLVLIVSAFYWPWLITVLIGALCGTISYWFIKVWSGQYKYYFEDPARRPNFFNPLEWCDLWKAGHFAAWSAKNYDRFLDNLVPYARDAMSIDENRAKFPRVGWGDSKDMKRNGGRKPEWFKQVWFAGNHSDIGGSYPESESRLSDIALDWMLSEMKECIPNLHVRDELIQTYPDPTGLQHDEIQAARDREPKWLFRWFVWSKGVRRVKPDAPLHPSVLKRLKAASVPNMGKVEPYRPEVLKHHDEAKKQFNST